ncbi:MAG: DUF169 domain-containing protein [Dehalococcoidales bacterium]|jgi:uncharacterized protein (DUF169 family)|nr:DUF169 domain-containing protein [Dehalococcoidales bacterium]
MESIQEYRTYGEELEKLLILRTSPLAIKMLATEADIPEGAIRPLKDRGYHLAQCQAFAMCRREKLTIAMLKEDHWCWAPLAGYGLVDPGQLEKFNATHFQAKVMPCLEYGKYCGLVSAPLRNVTFIPDLVLIYSNTAQLRSMLLAVKFKDRIHVHSEFDPIDSCVYSIVPVLSDRQYRITLPDPGEFQRAMAGEDEIIFSVPQEKLGVLVAGLKEFEKMHHGYASMGYEMRPDFPQPEFYRELFKAWGLG